VQMFQKGGYIAGSRVLEGQGLDHWIYRADITAGEQEEVIGLFA
jgi:hypothetical protein